MDTINLGESGGFFIKDYKLRLFERADWDRAEELIRCVRESGRDGLVRDIGMCGGASGFEHIYKWEDRLQIRRIAAELSGNSRTEVQLPDEKFFRELDDLMELHEIRDWWMREGGTSSEPQPSKQNPGYVTLCLSRA